jgi:hypothetical protein
MLVLATVIAVITGIISVFHILFGLKDSGEGIISLKWYLNLVHTSIYGQRKRGFLQMIFVSTICGAILLPGAEVEEGGALTNLKRVIQGSEASSER